MQGYLTIREASTPENLDRSPNWIRAGIRLGKIKAEKAGNTIVISIDEAERLKGNPPVITRKEMFG